MFFSPYKHLLETNNSKYAKLMLYGHEVMAPGVGEDHQARIIAQLLGISMVVTNDPTTSIMAAEGSAPPSGYGPTQFQDCLRYIFSEVLGYTTEKLMSADVLYGKLLGTREKFFSWGEVMQTLALRYWYKWPIAEALKLAAAPAFLLSASFLPFLPVDRNIFIAAWGAQTVFSLINYSLHWKSMGLSPIMGLWYYPMLERTKIYSYAMSALTQFYDRYQYAKFIMTSDGRGQDVPFPNRVTTAALAGLSGFATAVAVNDLLSGNFTQISEGMFTWAFLVNLFFCGLQTVQLMTASSFLTDASTNRTEAPISLAQFESLEEHREDNATLDEIAIKIRGHLQNPLSYEELFSIRGQLMALLRKFEAVDKVGRIRLEFSNDYSKVANYIAQWYSMTETLICLQASNDLNSKDADGQRSAAAIDNLHRLLFGTECAFDAPEPATRDFVVRNLASRLYRQRR